MPERSPSPSLSEGPPTDSIFAEAADEELADAIVAPERLAAAQTAKRRLGVLFWIAVGWIALIAVLAILAGVLPLEDPSRTGAGKPLEAPSLDHLLGTDRLGRDMLSRMVFGARVSLSVGFASVALGMLLGGTLGLLAGYYRGRLETAIMGVTDVMLSFPAIILALTFVTFLGRDLHWIVLAIGILAVPPIARIARANTLAYAQREFVLAARALGARDRRVLAREVLPNVVIPMASFALIVVAIAVVAEGTLAFLGLSVEAPTPTWGGMIVEGKDMLLVKDPAPHVALVPSIAMFLTVLAFNLAGDKLRAFFDVKEGAL